MNFNSIKFLIYLPIVLLGAWFIPKKFKWVWLLLASLYFYMSWNPILVFLIVGVTLVTWGSALIIQKTNSNALKKLFLILSLVITLGILVYFKYFGFLVENVVAFLNLFSMNLTSPTMEIILPIGISFYTFQSLGYVIDVYKNKYQAEKHLGYYALFVMYFPQLVAGPIERFNDLMPQLKNISSFNKENFILGLKFILVGFFRKCVIADFIGQFVNAQYANLANATSLSLIMTGILFCIQMYCDFAGYSEIALGSSMMLGVKLSKNFDQPYLAVSYSDFFRRWHITLNRWFTDYLYIPMGGSRKGLIRKLLNILIVFSLSGLWHGANWNYLLWGLYAGFFLCIESIFRKPFLNFCQNHNINLEDKAIILLRRTLMFIIYIPSALIFRSQNIEQIGTVFSTLFTKIGFGDTYFNASLSAMNFNTFAILFFIIGLVIIWYLYHFVYDDYDRLGLNLETPVQSKFSFQVNLHVCLVLIIAISLGWIYIVSLGEGADFAYFQF